MFTTTGHACGGILLVKHQHSCALQGVRFTNQPGGGGCEGKLECGQGSRDRAHHDGSPSSVSVFSFGMVPFWGRGALCDIGRDSAVL